LVKKLGDRKKREKKRGGENFGSTKKEKKLLA